MYVVGASGSADRENEWLAETTKRDWSREKKVSDIVQFGLLRLWELGYCDSGSLGYWDSGSLVVFDSESFGQCDSGSLGFVTLGVGRS